jgi:hypothetical protein
MVKGDVELNLNSLNHSELVTLARWLDIQASRAVPRDMLIHAIENFVGLNFTDSIRVKGEKLSAWLGRYWEQIQMQARKKVCPNCHLCRDAQVLECYELNKKKFGGK